MSWCNDCSDAQTIERISSPPSSPANNSTGNYNNNETVSTTNPNRTCSIIIRSCPSCGHQIRRNAQARIHDLPGLPAGVKFDPTDQELLHHLEAKARADACKLHPLIDEFIPTLEGENGICYAHPEKLPGVGKDGLIRHFFHRPSKAYTTGTRKRRKVLHTDEEDGETRWHKTGKTRPVFGGGKVKGYKKILVLYTNYGKQKKPEKTSWVMHQYHLGNNAEEKDGELVVSKVFYQTQPRHCGVSGSSTSLLPPKFIKSGSKQSGLDHHHHHQSLKNNDDHGVVVKYYNSAAAAASFMSFDDQGSAGGTGHFASHHHHDDRTSSFVP